MSNEYEAPYGQSEPNEGGGSGGGGNGGGGNGGNGRSSLNVFGVVESIILAMSVGLMLWVANLVVEHGKILAAHDTMLKVDDSRLDSLEVRGSPSLGAHMVEENSELSAVRARLDKMEAAVLILQTTPGELRAISVRLESIKEAQVRMERALDDATTRLKP